MIRRSDSYKIGREPNIENGEAEAAGRPGKGGGSVVDLFLVYPEPSIDILWVINPWRLGRVDVGE